MAVVPVEVGWRDTHRPYVRHASMYSLVAANARL
jgi:hypothetical protein